MTCRFFLSMSFSPPFGFHSRCSFTELHWRVNFTRWSIFSFFFNSTSTFPSSPFSCLSFLNLQFDWNHTLQPEGLFNWTELTPPLGGGLWLIQSWFFAFSPLPYFAVSVPSMVPPASVPHPQHETRPPLSTLRCIFLLGHFSSGLCLYSLSLLSFFWTELNLFPPPLVKAPPTKP